MTFYYLEAECRRWYLSYGEKSNMKRRAAPEVIEPLRHAAHIMYREAYPESGDKKQ